MDKATRNAIERATQQARRLLDEDFSSQLEGTFDVLRSGVIASNGGAHLSPHQQSHRHKIAAAIEHKRATGMTAAEAVRDYVRDAAFTTLNRFVALKMLEARELVQECITKGEQSAGYREFCGMAPGLALLPEAAGYRLYIESLFDEFSTEIKVLFDRSDAASVLWPKRQTFEALLAILNAPDLSGVWDEDETIGWVYQFFNGGDERRAMREASQVPQNGRELAVRNQFFTPRYVVQFLTDNTLGRVWCEMRNGETALREQCEYLVVRSGDPSTPRTKRDPRDLHVLDPACGSGHFLLYAFDLLSTIYEEAYRDADGPKSEATGRTLLADYPNIDALRRALPVMILAHNLHGVDIDPRCAQIAQLALWMRAQRTYRHFGIPREERPLIRRSNIVVAEPLVTDEGVLTEFLAKLGDAELVRVFTELIDSLKLAGDLGILLRVEGQIAREPKRGETGELFAPPEARIRDALLQFVVASNISGRTSRRLFADDAVQGVGLLEIAEKKFDVVLMNPPFGAATAKSTTHECLNNASGGDLYSAFVARGLELLHPVGRLGAITPRSFIYQLDFIDYRRDWLLPNAQLPLLVELGFGELDEASNRTAAYVVGRKSDTIEPTLYANIGTAPDKRERLLALTRGDQPWTLATLNDAADPYTSALLFRMTPALRTKLAEYRRLDPVLGKSHRGSRNGVVQLVNGLQCPEDFRYVRLQVEVRPIDIGHRWVPFLKPISFTPYVGEVACVVNWKESGAEQKAAFVGAGVSPSKYVSGEGFYPALGVWFPDVSERGIAASLIPYPAIPGRKGLLAALPENAPFSAEALTGFMNSIWAEGLLGLITPERHHKPSYVGQIPWIPAVASTAESYNRAIVDLVSREAPTELSPFFTLPDVVRYRRSTIAETADWLQRHWFATGEEISHQIAEFDDVILRAVGASDDDAALLREMSQRGPVESWFPSEHDLNAPLVPQLAADLVSFGIGRCLGRHQATEARESNLRVQKRDSMPIQPSTTEGTNLVDDAGHPLDIIAAVMRTLTKFWSDGDGILDELGRTLSPDDGDLRSWVSRKFFSFHLARYTKSRRAAPIYWQLATPSASYSVWLYLHAFTKDTLYKIQNDYVAQKVGHEERKLESLRRELGGSPNAINRKSLAAQETFVDELRAFFEEMKRVAPLWSPSLDDGVIVNFAPLWRLVPHHKPWQKELKATWDGLCAGDFDWAHLAMHLWPERVIPKCASDRSLAIAHGLEDVFWVEGGDGKSKPRPTPTRPVDELVRERTSLAVKSALKNLLEAPIANANGGRRRGRRAANAAADGGAR